MEKVYIDFKDENVAKYIGYGDETYLYIDENKTQKISANDLADIFVKGMFIDIDGVKYIPISIEHTDAFGSDIAYETVTYVKADSTSASTPVLATVRSSNVEVSDVVFNEE